MSITKLSKVQRRRKSNVEGNDGGEHFLVESFEIIDSTINLNGFDNESDSPIHKMPNEQTGHHVNEKPVLSAKGRVT